MSAESSREFFIQRSFELVWAIFRVSEFTTKIKIKEALEDKAVEYLLYKDKISLLSLEEVIHLAIQIKEINKVNGDVLLREVNNLKSAMGEMIDENGQNIFTRRLPENAPDIENIFAKPPVLLSDFMEMVGGLPESGNRNIEKEEDNADINKEEGVKSEESSKTAVDKEKSGKVWQGLARSGNAESLAKSGNIAVNKEKSGNASMGVIKRREYILNTVKDRHLCHIKDILAEFPKTSPRTIRHDIKKMVDGGNLERVGSGGPNSFFRVKNELSS